MHGERAQRVCGPVLSHRRGAPCGRPFVLREIEARPEALEGYERATWRRKGPPFALSLSKGTPERTTHRAPKAAAEQRLFHT